MLITTPWYVTLNGVTVLGESDAMSDEPSIERHWLVQTVQPIRAANPLYIPRLNASHTLSFGRISVCETAAAARALMLAWDAALPTVAGNCIVTLADSGGTFILSGALIGEDGFKCHTKANLCIAQYQIIGGTLTWLSGTSDPSGTGWPQVMLIETPTGGAATVIVNEEGIPVTTETGEEIGA